MKDKDSEYMRLALELAQKGYGYVAPNPLVGAVVVKEDRIIGQGWHERFGQPHAERNALAACIEDPKGADMYVTLEPCPMCAGAILHARLDQVIFGTRDPKGGAVCSVEQMFELPYNWKPQVMEGMLQPACAAVLQDFFRQLRQKKKAADSAAEKR